MNVLLDWKVSNFKHFNQDGNPYDAKLVFDVYGNIKTGMPGKEYFDVVPTVLESVLDKYFDMPGISKAILKEWADNRILEIGTDGRKAIKAIIKTGEGQTRVYRIKLASLGGDL